MGFLRFIFSKVFIKNLTLSILILLVIFFSVFLALRLYTNHGKSEIIPDLKGLNELQLSTILEKQALRYEIIDSLYTDSVPRGTLWEQIPSAGSKVKKHRKLFLIMNAHSRKSVAMPDINDLSLRQAKTVLESSGLKIGKTLYVPSEFRNLVVGQHFNGIEIEPGTPIPQGSSVDVLVANGLSDEIIKVPNLIGLRLQTAVGILTKNGLSIGATILKDNKTFDSDTNEDSLFVIEQKPVNNTEINIGSSVSLWLDTDSLKEVVDSLQIEP